MADVLQATPRNEWLGVPADLLAKLRTIADVAKTMGSAGEPAALLSLLIGKSPELLNRLSYGGSFAEPPQATGPDPSIAQKYSGAIDLGGMVPAGKILGVAKALASAAPLGAALGHIKQVKEIAPEMLAAAKAHAATNFTPAEIEEARALEDFANPGATRPQVHGEPSIADEMGYPSIDESMSTRSEAPAIAHIPQDPAIKEHLQFLDQQGLSPEDINTIQKYTQESVPQISSRYTEAQKNAAEMLGLGPNNTIVERRLESPYDTTRLVRGTTTRRQEITTPLELNSAENSTGWPHPMTFASVGQPGDMMYAQSYKNKLPVRATSSMDELFNPESLVRPYGEAVDSYGNLTQPLHPFEEKFLAQYDKLKQLEKEGNLNLPEAYSHEAKQRQAAGDTESTIFRDPEWAIRQWREAGAKAWPQTERPDVVATLQSMGLPGFRTSESGTNVAHFDPRFRYENAAFDPARLDERNLFASTLLPTAGISALAAMLLPQEPPSQ